ncbi:MAG: hypothetical protein WED05_05675 [Candidatus Atabeyarchaeum deiterrae]
MDIMLYLREFVIKIPCGIEIYSEASIKYELAFYLRGVLGKKYKIQLERNIDFFQLSKEKYWKKEMDIVVFTPDEEGNTALS